MFTITNISDSEDTWRHSSWLSFMNKKLKLAKDLLTEDGVIFISIDNNEYAKLKLLCDSVFGEVNFVVNLIRKTSFGEKSAKPNINKHHKYCLCYAKDINALIKSDILNGDDKTFDGYSNPDEDINGNWKKDSTLIKIDSGRQGLAKYPITNVHLGITDYPPVVHDSSIRKQWHYSESTFKILEANGQVVYYKTKDEMKNNTYSFYIKKYQKDINQKYMNISSLYFDTSEYVNALGTKLLKDLYLANKFSNSYPKPISFIKKIIDFSTKNKKNAVILDFFAGSGTTGHAVLELNKEDGGTRKFILCTNNKVSYQKEIDYLEQIGRLNGVSKNVLNESYKEYQSKDEYVFFKESEDYAKLGICRSVTYERIKRVIKGYTTPKGLEVSGIHSNLQYFKVETLDSNVNPMEIEDEVIDNIIPFIQFKHNVWDKETVVEDLIKLTSEKEDIYVHMNKLYLCDGFYDSINNKGKPIVLYIYDGLFEILDAARLGNVKVVSIPSEFYKK